MMSADFMLELCNVFYSGQVEPGSCMQQILGTIKTGVILKDVSIMVQSGEVLAVLGSKGSGKKALLDVISRRVQGPTRGQILLNNQPMSRAVFQQRCGYVTHDYNFIPGLTVEQTLYFVPTTLSGYLKKSKVKQIMADLALSQVANRCVENISLSESRRLMVGVQLIKDPVLLLLDEPTWNLDPLNTYLVVSILSNAAKKYGTAIILTMEKPRSDVFPFLDRVLYLCLGDVVYAGKTRQMLDYFNVIGFPCPQLENPLMYYLCLSTVDRRSRERFVESNNQIAALVEKFKVEGLVLAKSTSDMRAVESGLNNKVLLPQSKISCFSVAWLLYIRLLAATFNFNWTGMKQTFLRIFLQPLYYLCVWLFYSNIGQDQYSVTSKIGFVFNCLIGTHFTAIMNALILYPTYRKQYSQEAQEGLYGGGLFLFAYNCITIPASLASMFISSAIVFPLVGQIFEQWEDYIYFTLTLYTSYLVAEQVTIALLIIIKDYIKAAISSLYIISLSVALGSGVLRSFKGLQEWLFYLTYALQIRYATLYLFKVILVGSLSESSILENTSNCTLNAQHSTLQCFNKQSYMYLSERYSRENNMPKFAGIFDENVNFYMSVAVSLGVVFVNFVLHLLPMSSMGNSKFR